MDYILSNNSKREYEAFSEEYKEKAIEVLERGVYISGQEVEEFEKEWAAFLGVKHCISVGNGLDALWIALLELGIGSGDEVIVPTNSFVASALAVSKCVATPVFADADSFYGIDVEQVQKLITKRTRAVMAVHLYGMPCEMGKLKEICDENKLFLIEDCAQSHGAAYKGKMTGTIGNVGCFSFYPTKNLGAFGDGGCIVTNDDDLADRCRIYKNYGSEKKYHNSLLGTNSRLDEMQAGLLRVKLSHYREIMKERRRLAKRYTDNINNPLTVLPQTREDTDPVWHQYVIRCDKRDSLIDDLSDRGIGTNIHYPIPIHLQEAYKSLGYEAGSLPVSEKYAETVISLPLYFGMTEVEQDRVIEALNDFR